jgi:serine-type D-Ala-D-Ala carboxypeptidase (penicillin-binding protein 5/6)
VLRRGGLLPIAAALALQLVLPCPALASRLSSDAVDGVALSAGKVARSAAPNIEAASGILVTASGRVLWSRQPDAQRAMASTTKMMTALLVLKHGELDDQVTVSHAASRVQDGAGLVPGQQVSERKLLELMLIPSANDAAFALAEGVGGTEPKFVAMMNAEARALGLKHTHFANPHGLDAAGHYSSAADLAKLVSVVMREPEFRRIVQLRSVSISGPGGSRTFASTDHLLGQYAGIAGGKTGYTDHAGYCFVTSAHRDGVTLFAAVLGTDSTDARFSQAARLLDWGFAHLRKRLTVSVGQRFGAAKVAGGGVATVAVASAEATDIPVFDLNGPVVPRVSLLTTVAAPVFTGEPLGFVTWSQAGRTVARIPLLAAETRDAAGEAVGAVPVADFVDRAVTARIQQVASSPAFAPTGAISRHIVLAPAVTAPVAAGQRLGEIVYEQGSRVVVRVPLVAEAAVTRPAFLQRLGVWCVRCWRGVMGGQKMAALEIKGP